ncbi:GH1 family beta-glucosidase [Dyadobacter chenhuakuii]|uniref:Beta-glucosidase n=1 Tax=Dyadobacter chenhuakuii TaxID=2909339 RepID=A0ABY4XEM9_9BACT|nr:GH1 family beta-glucosidase [Dyadobacter chenhuakuii]MCF2492076.1 GH1 family beta-glucosidase [Dyadobacter chenhuakuii]USJ28764.1 GH1 family beta-glucosidase [Dyadobacter chenhuakuii]
MTTDIHFNKQDFGADFSWGVATAAYQIEGAVDVDGRGPCVWDKFATIKGKIKNGDDARIACDFYNRFESDIELIHALGFKEFRFSISWSRILPKGYGEVNEAGILFYNKLIDKCLSLDIVPWITLYHWDLPQALEDLGGWKNRRILEWFESYATICANAFGDRVKKWIVLNEPMAVAGLGYTTGLHAPGRKSISNFLPVVHHLAMCQAIGGEVIRRNVADAYIGTAISCSYVHPASASFRDIRAAKRADALMNRLFIEPALGMGYPADAFRFLGNIKRYMQPGDAERLKFDFDFIGIQNYFSVVVKHSYFAPVVWLKEVPAKLRNVPVTAMGWEVSSDGMYHILKQFDAYDGIREIIVSENGAAFHDQVEGENVHDPERKSFYQEYLAAILKAKNEGVKVKGYLAWTMMDNFEWAEGYAARFGLVHVDFKTQKRTVKDSGKWFASFLKM